MKASHNPNSPDQRHPNQGQIVEEFAQESSAPAVLLQYYSGSKGWRRSIATLMLSMTAWTSAATLPVLAQTAPAEPAAAAITAQTTPTQTTPAQIPDQTAEQAPDNAAEATGGLTQTTPAPAQTPPGVLSQPNRTIIPPSSNTAPFENAYLLGPGDQIQVDIFDVPELSGEAGRQVVLIDGTVRLPWAGSVRVQGLSLDQAASAISSAYAPYINNPLVSVNLRAVRTLRVSVAGEVKRPGAYVINPSSGPATTVGEGAETVGDGTVASQWPTLSQAIQVAGGITQSADLRQVQIRRPQPNGAIEVIDANLWDLVKSGNLNQDVRLRDRDIVYIPTATALSNDEAIAQGAANLSPATIQVNVVGEVGSPGVVEVPPNTPLNQVLLAAGGFNSRRARRSDVELIRLNPNGTASRRTVNVDLAAGVNEETNPSLREYDTVVVSRSGIARVGDDIGNFLAPFGGILGAVGGIFGIID